MTAERRSVKEVQGRAQYYSGSLKDRPGKATPYSAISS